MHPSPHRREISITTCRVWDTICVLQSKGELHLQMAASADKQATSTNVGSSFQHPIPTAVQHAVLHAFSDSPGAPGESPRIGLCARFLGPCPQKQKTQPPIPSSSSPQKKCAVWGTTPNPRAQKMRLQAGPVPLGRVCAGKEQTGCEGSKNPMVIITNQPTTMRPRAASADCVCKPFCRRPVCKQCPQHSPDSITCQQAHSPLQFHESTKGLQTR